MAAAIRPYRGRAADYDQSDRIARLNGEMVDLSARELGLLEILLLRAGRLVSKEQLVDQLCGWGEEVSTNAIEVYVHRLRKKMEGDGARIITVRGLGYCLEKPGATPSAASGGKAASQKVPLRTAGGCVLRADAAQTVCNGEPQFPVRRDTGLDAGTAAASCGRYRSRTNHVANDIANQPYDQALADSVTAIAQLVRIDGQRVRVVMPASARACCIPTKPTRSITR